MRCRAHFLALVLALLSLAAGAQVRFTNPILHEDWSDPDVCRVGDDYYMTASSFNHFPGLPVLHSRDLVNWEQIGAALTGYREGLRYDSGEVRHGEGAWAPAIRYHDGWFYIFCGDPDEGIFMVRTQDPAGAWEKPVWVVREKGFIDPCPLWDEDGRAWLSHGCAGSRAGLKSVLFVAPMAPDGTRLTGPSRMVFDGHETQPTIEGTKFYRRKGMYYIFAPAGGVKTGWQSVLRAAHPLGPYEERIVMAAGEGTINGPHQGAWVDTPSGSDWFIHFQDKGAYGRIVHLQPLRWGADGWPVIGDDPDRDGCGEPVTSWEAPLGVTNLVFNEWDDRLRHPYKPYGLDPAWQYPCVPSPFWHYALPDGGVRLFSACPKAQVRTLWDCPNLLMRKFPDERFKLYARLDFRPGKSLGEKGGLVVMGSSYAALRLVDEGEGARLEYAVCSGADRGGEEKVDSLTFLPYAQGAASVYVCLQVYPREGTPVARFSYSLDGGEYTKMPSGFVCACGRWVGAKTGFWCSRTEESRDGGHLDVTGLRITRELGDHRSYQYDEQKVPAYTLPDALTLRSGKKVKTVRDWEKRRRPELLDLFATYMYGKTPVGRPEELHWKLLSSAPALDGAALRKEVAVWFNREETQGLTLLLYIPAARHAGAPVILGANFMGNASVEPGGEKAYRWPLAYAVGRGYAVATFCYNDVDPDWDDGFRNGVIGYYGPAERDGSSWGNIAAWAWGLSRALDYLENDPDVAADKVAVLGHSRLGKTALWAGATDPRFAVVISNASGCGGAAISRRRYGETIHRICSTFPYWWCSNLYRFADNEPLLPFDQHELLALIAPRPLYVQSCEDDLWADPRGEALSLEAAAQVYALYGRTDVLGRHVREGKHDIVLADWQHYLDFTDRFFQ